MNFISWSFVILVLPLLIFRWAGRRQDLSWPFKFVLFITSAIFILWQKPIYVLIMLGCLINNYFAAQLISKLPDGSAKKKLTLFGSLGINLLMLGFFKYSNFAIEGVESLGHWIGHANNLPRLAILLPVGISFYTFSSMSYTIDVYRDRKAQARNFYDFYYFITFFPHLVAGPIIRAEQFLYQLYRQRSPSFLVFNQGAYLIIQGLFLKMVCADTIDVLLANWWQTPNIKIAHPITLVMMALLFSVQIYCDFSGYSNIARGLAYWLGFRFPINFNFPYIANSFSNFWRRWHITLSSWLRDYLYHPLGGNKRGRFRTSWNLMFVMILGGLWHGSAITFLFWGFLHGAALVVERLLGMNVSKADRPTILKISWFLVVQFIVVIAFVYFRSESMLQANLFIKQMFYPAAHLEIFGPWLEIVIALGILGAHLHAFLVERGTLRSLTRLEQSILGGALVYTILAFYGRTSEFIYFQF